MESQTQESRLRSDPHGVPQVQYRRTRESVFLHDPDPALPGDHVVVLSPRSARDLERHGELVIQDGADVGEDRLIPESAQGSRSCGGGRSRLSSGGRGLGGGGYGLRGGCGCGIGGWRGCGAAGAGCGSRARIQVGVEVPDPALAGADTVIRKALLGAVVVGHALSPVGRPLARWCRRTGALGAAAGGHREK